MTTSLVGCGQKQKSTLDIVKERGTLIVGVRYDAPPYGSLAENNEVEGLDIDIARYIANKLGVEIEFKQVTSKTRIPELENGNVDLLSAAMAHTIEREEAVDYSLPYFESYTLLLTHKDSGITSFDDLDGKIVAVTQGTPYAQHLETRYPKAIPLVMQEDTMCVDALKSGQADAHLNGEDILFGLVKLDPNFVIVGDPTIFPSFEVGLGVRENDSDWRDFINFTLIDMWETGAYQEAHLKNFGFPVNPAFKIPGWKL